VKTVRSYVRDGRLEAVRIGRQYRIGADALEAFAGRPVTPPHSGPARAVEVSSIVQIDDVDRALADRVSTLVMSSVGGAPPDDGRLRVETAYDEGKSRMKIIVLGGPESTAALSPGSPMTSGAYTPWLGDVLDGLSVPRASVVAISLGGWIALDYATRHPQRVERMVLLTPPGVARQKSGAVLAGLLLKPFGEWGKRKSVELALGPVLRTLPRQADDFVQLVARHFRYRREPVPVVDDDALRRATMPLLVVLGARDALIDSRRTAERLSRLVPSATVRVLPAAGHLLPAQTEPIVEFLEG
jgi:excisionase family DNA binding protein